MRVAVAYDHRGRTSVECVRAAIEGCKHKYMDLGPREDCVVDCPDIAYAAATAVIENKADTAILLCTTGIGMDISANKVKGIRAVRCCDEIDARVARNQFNANVLCLSSELLGQRLITKIVETWLECSFDKRTRSERLIQKIRAIEEGRDPREIAKTCDSIDSNKPTSSKLDIANSR